MADSADLTPDAQRSMDTLGSALGSPVLKGRCFEIRGYADETGSAEYNRRLSEERARSVVNYLNYHGIEKDRLIAIGFGKLYPRASDATEAGREKNRRVEVVSFEYGAALADKTSDNAYKKLGRPEGQIEPNCAGFEQLISRGIYP
jgi:outer membrane protein OmpA-like peptidoglycan-associated protein